MSTKLVFTIKAGCAVVIVQPGWFDLRAIPPPTKSTSDKSGSTPPPPPDFFPSTGFVCSLARSLFHLFLAGALRSLPRHASLPRLPRWRSACPGPGSGGSVRRRATSKTRARHDRAPPRLLRWGGGTPGGAGGQEAEAEGGADTLDALPDGCLFEVLRRVQGARAWGASSCVSHRWLALLGGIRAFEIKRAQALAVPDLNQVFICEDEAGAEAASVHPGRSERTLEVRGRQGSRPNRDGRPPRQPGERPSATALFGGVRRRKRARVTAVHPRVFSAVEEALRTAPAAKKQRLREALTPSTRSRTGASSRSRAACRAPARGAPPPASPIAGSLFSAASAPSRSSGPRPSPCRTSTRSSSARTRTRTRPGPRQPPRARAAPRGPSRARPPRTSP
ncbi:translation initiation factor IF-2-like [Hordeum vulgare subsp. vulgare]|uniref:translation initiation factor IF-2-like n=1 Tax=Hordeum vulgare subsp. vulgare TaxID=112509 RepID=UPI001D1A52DC|nr:translation initiation factor IF-2-like [Hordeum vulgare subsp. vulgare]